MWKWAVICILALVSCGGNMPIKAWPGLGPEIRERYRQPAQGVPAAVGLFNPPDTYENAAGLWRLDMDEATDPAKVLTGVRSIWFKNTASQALLQHDAEHAVSIQANRRYKAWATVQADSVASGKTVDCYVDWYAADRTTLVSSSTVHSDVLTSVSTWQQISDVVVAPTSAYYARMRFGRTGVSFNAYFDQVDMVEAVPTWQLYLGVDQAIPTGTQTDIVWRSARLITDVDIPNFEDAGIIDLTPATANITILVPGYYYITAQAWFELMADTDSAQILLRVNGSLIRRGTIQQAARANATIAAQINTLMELAQGDVVTIRVLHDNGADRNISGDAAQTYCDGTRIV